MFHLTQCPSPHALHLSLIGSLFLFFFLNMPLATADHQVLENQSMSSTVRVSISSTGMQAAFGASTPAISDDGRLIVFTSFSADLVSNDTNNDCWNGRYFENCPDVFVHDQQTGQTTRISVASDGTQANGASDQPAISADGRYVSFASSASNLAPNDTNTNVLCEVEAPANCADIFVHDRQSGETSHVSVSSDGTQANRESETPAISADGRYIAFVSYASNLVPNDTNQYPDVFIHDHLTGQTTLASRATDGTLGNNFSLAPALSADGRYVAFTSWASNLVPNDTNTVCSPLDKGTANCPDIFVHDQQTGQTTRLSVASDGTQGNGPTSDIPGQRAAISGDGRYIAFASAATNLVPSDTNGATDVFVHDRQTGQTIRVSVASDGTPANQRSAWGYASTLALSRDGRYIGFASAASNLVPNDTNVHEDIFLHDRLTHQTARISIASVGTQGDDNSDQPIISSDGRFVAFRSWASNLVLDDTNGYPDIFIHDRGSVRRIYLPLIDGQP